MSSGNSLLKFRDNLSVPSSRVKNTRRGLDSWTLKMEPIGGPETSVRNYHYSLRNKPEESSSHLLHGGSLKSLRSIRFTSSALVRQTSSIKYKTNASVRQVPSGSEQIPWWIKLHQALVRHAPSGSHQKPQWCRPHEADIKYLAKAGLTRLTSCLLC